MHNSTLKSSNSNINVISSSYTHEQFIPEEAYLYFPSPSTTSSSKLHRSLFEGAIFYTQLENKAITEIYPKLKPETQKHITKSDIMRFLLHNCNSSQKTIMSLEKYIFLKQSILTYPLSSPPESIVHFLNRGIVYSFGRDHNFRPNIIIDIINVLKCGKVMSKDFIVKALFYFLHFMIEYLLLPGQVEQWNVIMNTNGKSVEYDDEFKYVFNILTDYFPQRLHMLFIYNCDSIGCFMWNFFKIALENKTQVNNQVVILRQDKAHNNNSNSKNIFDYIHEEQLEKKFGGLEDNVTHNYFPPYVDNKKHKRYYKSDEIDCRRKIIDKDSYIDKMKREGQYYKVNRNIYAGNIQSNNDNNIGQLCNSIKGISNKTIEVSTAETVKHEKATDNNNNNTNMLKEQEQEDVIKDILPPLMMQEIIIEHPYEYEQISTGTCSFLCRSSSSVVNKQQHHNYSQCILF